MNKKRNFRLKQKQLRKRFKQKVLKRSLFAIFTALSSLSFFWFQLFREQGDPLISSQNQSTTAVSTGLAESSILQSEPELIKTSIEPQIVNRRHYEVLTKLKQANVFRSIKSTINQEGSKLNVFSSATLKPFALPKSVASLMLSVGITKQDQCLNYHSFINASILSDSFKTFPIGLSNVILSSEFDLKQISLSSSIIKAKLVHTIAPFEFKIGMTTDANFGRQNNFFVEVCFLEEQTCGHDVMILNIL